MACERKCGNGNSCLMRDHCYRYWSKPDPYQQLYVNYEPEKSYNCSGFWDRYMEELEQ